MVDFACAVAAFVRALQRCDTTDGPLAGDHSWHRGASPAYYDRETRRCLARLDGHIDIARAAAVWQQALDASWHGAPVWFHGDIAPGNLLVAGGSLTAVIDFGTCGVGDPACDLVIAWTMFSGSSRQAFRHAVDQDEATWARARGWALWKAMLTLTENPSASPHQAAVQRHVIAEILTDDDRNNATCPSN